MELEQRKLWNERHKLLTSIIAKPKEHQNALALFLDQHACLYVSDMAGVGAVTYEDELWADIHEETLRQYPVQSTDTQNSIAWHLWHIARVEDITMNLLVADTPQVLHTDHHLQRLNIPFVHSGNGMTEEEVAQLSASIDLGALLSYRVAVGQRTREIIANQDSIVFKQKVKPERVNRIIEEQAVKPEASWLIEYWAKKNIAGLILMPATRHNFVHLNKSMRIKSKLEKKHVGK